MPVERTSSSESLNWSIQPSRRARLPCLRRVARVAPKAVNGTTTRRPSPACDPRTASCPRSSLSTSRLAAGGDSELIGERAYGRAGLAIKGEEGFELGHGQVQLQPLGDHIVEQGTDQGLLLMCDAGNPRLPFVHCFWRC